jgi:periplasmic protein CpxP/Spy
MKRTTYQTFHPSVRVVVAALLAVIGYASPSRAVSADLVQVRTSWMSPQIILAQAASPQSPAGQASGTPAAPKASRADRVEARIKDLHEKLKITPEQEDQWKNVAQVMRDNAKTMEELTKARTEKAKTVNAVDDLKSYAEITEAHADELKKFIPAFESLYNSMSDEQKKNADTIFRSHGRGRGRAGSKSTTPKTN